MQVVVVGAGALGSTLAIAFARAGDDVTLLVRHHELSESLQRHMYLSIPGQEQLWAITPTVTELSESPDLVIIATQTQDIVEACLPLAGILPTVHAVITTQLGTRGDGIVQQYVGAATSVFHVVPDFTVALDPTGQLTFAGQLHMQIGQGSGPNNSPLLGQLAATIGMTIATDAVPTIAPYRWTRLFFSLPEPLFAIGDLPLAASTTEKSLMHANLVILREAAKVVVAQDISLAPQPSTDIDRWLKVPNMLGLFADRFIHQQEAVFNRFGQFPSPSQQHLQRHRSTEVGDINGEIVRLGHEKGIPTPVNERIIEEVQAVERTGALLNRDALLKIISKL